MSAVSTQYEATIGLEVHVQLKTKTKMFCGCVNEFGAPPNSHVCPICLGLPGVLPMPNEQAIIHTILTGLMLDCTIAERCKFDRKNYFYPDMPKNYQISQYDEPLCSGGAVPLNLLAFPKDAQNEAGSAADKKIRLIRIHLEEDVAKSFHFEDGKSGIDFNRAGTPLMEIVSEADIASPEEAFAYLTALKQILIDGKVSDADMEKGQLRCDVNVSIRPKGQKEFGTKIELKNLNSISGVRRALKFEIDRQIAALSEGGSLAQETRRWDDDKGQTSLMRTKEKAHDYRYFPDPDLLPVSTIDGLMEKAHRRLPENLEARKRKIEDTYEIGTDYSNFFVSNATHLELLIKATELGTLENKNQLAHQIVNNPILGDFYTKQPEAVRYVVEFSNLLSGGKINNVQGRQVLAAMLEQNKSPNALVAELGLSQVSDTGELEKWCKEAIASNPKSVADYKSGKQNAINAFTGYVMKQSKGKANPKLVSEILQKLLQS